MYLFNAHVYYMVQESEFA